MSVALQSSLPWIVTGVGLWLPGVPDQRAWQSGARGVPQDEAPPPQGALLDKRTRRRASGLCRALADAFADAALAADVSLASVASVFGSSLGEVSTMLTVLEQTNCRSGPGQDYEILFTYLPGKELEILGRYEPDNYWLVKSEESPTGTCWLWGQFVELKGSFSAVSSVTPPATATKPPPGAPSVEWTFTCSGGTMTVNLNWQDRASDETGYRIFRNGEAIAELPANSTAYVDTFEFTAGEDVDYYVQVYSPFGSANSTVMRMTC